jgi:hypothetical protein
MSACALVALSGVAPRVAIARGTISQQSVSFVQAIGVAPSRAPGLRVPRGDAVFTTGTARILMDSLVSVRRAGEVRAAAGPRDVVIQELVVDSSVVRADSAMNVVWTRRVPPVLEQR